MAMVRLRLERCARQGLGVSVPFRVDRASVDKLVERRNTGKTGISIRPLSL